jgi:hypothetical protein
LSVILAGNGPKEIDIREVIEREGTEDRVALGKFLSSNNNQIISSFLFRRVS